MRMQNNSYNKENKITYNDYKKKMIINKRQNMMMFVSIFLVLLLVFLGVAKIMSPDVDITLGDDGSQDTQVEDEFRGNIDSRLKELQAEDELATEKVEASAEDGGLVRIPKHEDKSHVDSIPDSNVLSEGPEHIAKKDNTKVVESPAAQTQAVTPAPQAVKTYRVYVGSYSTQAQAEVAKGILQEANLGVSPHIKNAGGLYTLQVGAFSSHESAVSLSNKLLMNNYPARVVSD